MRVCVTAVGPGLDAQVDPRFGRAQYFVFVDTETMEAESVQNPNVNAFGGAGIQSAQLVAERGAKVVITGHVGPNAAGALGAAGVEVVTGVSGMTVKQAVEGFKSGELESSRPAATAPAHSGQSGALGSEEMRLRQELEDLKRRLSELEKRVKELES